jgi:hypothetical protein
MNERRRKEIDAGGGGTSGGVEHVDAVTLPHSPIYSPAPDGRLLALSYFFFLKDQFILVEWYMIQNIAATFSLQSALPAFHFLFFFSVAVLCSERIPLSIPDEPF